MSGLSVGREIALFKNGCRCWPFVPERKSFESQTSSRSFSWRFQSKRHRAKKCCKNLCVLWLLSANFFFISDGWIGGLRDLGSMILHIQSQHSLAEKATTNWPRSFNWFYVVTRHQEPRVYRAFDLPTPNMFLFQECHLALGEHCVGPQPASVVCCYLLLVRDFLNWGFKSLKFEIMGPQLND